jgi:hypothetical protein
MKNSIHGSEFLVMGYGEDSTATVWTIGYHSTKSGYFSLKNGKCVGLARRRHRRTIAACQQKRAFFLCHRNEVLITKLFLPQDYGIFTIMLKTIPLAIATFILSLTSYTQIPVNAKSPANYQISQNVQQSGKITLENLGIGGIKLSMSEAEVRKILGKPVKVENADSPAIGKVRTLKYPGISVDLAEDFQSNKFTVYQIKATSSKYSTIDGVKVGDRRSKVIRTYGNTDAYKDGNTTHLSYSIETPSPAGLNFTVEKGKITEILGFYVMN